MPDSASSEDGGYDLVPEDPAPPPGDSGDAGRPGTDGRRGTSKRRHARSDVADVHEDEDEDEDDDDAEMEGQPHGGNEDGDDEDSLPPPISLPSSPQPWLVVAGLAVAVLLVSWLAGAPQLVLPETASDGTPLVRELGFFERLEGIARTIVYLPLATLGGVFGLLVLAFLRQRPVGDVSSMFAKVAALVAVSMTLWLVPSDIRFLKQAINVVGVPAAAGILAIPAFRLVPRDAMLAAIYTLLCMLLLVLIANTVVWAVAG